MKHVDLTGSRRKSGGAECSFFVQTIKGKKVGVKVYPSARDANFALKKQTKLSNLDLAPKVLSKRFKVKLFEPGSGCSNRGLNGFITEIAETKRSQKSWALRNKLYNDLKPFNMHYDLSPRNVGFVKRSGRWKMVLIDCGRYSRNLWK